MAFPVSSLFLLFFCVPPSDLFLLGRLCDHADTNFTTISHLKVEKCFSPTEDQVSEDTVNAMLIQNQENQHLQGYQCFVEQIRRGFFCGQLHHNFDISNLNYYHPRTIKLTRVECQVLRDTKRISLHTSYFEADQPISYFKTFISGYTYGRGSCSGGTYTLPDGQVYSGVVVYDEYRIEHGPVNIIRTSKDIQFNGVSFPPNDETLYDDRVGTLIFDRFDKPCSALLGELYTGPVTKLTDTHGVISYFHNSTQSGFFVTVDNTVELCGFTVYSVQVPGVYVLEWHHQPPLQLTRANEAPILSYLVSELKRLSQGTIQSIKRVFSTLWLEICQARRRLLIHKIQSLPQNQLRLWDQNHLVQKTGEVVRLLQCPEVSVTLAPSSHCFEELPVSFQNTTFYLQAETRLLLPEGTPLPCDPIYPQVFKYRNQWIQTQSDHRGASPPDSINPNRPSPFQFHPLLLSKGGLYSLSQIKNSQNRLFFPPIRSARVSKWVTDSLSHPHLGSGIGSALGTDVLTMQDKLSEFTTSTWNAFSNFGTFVSALLGIYYFFVALKTIFSTILNCKELHENFGWSVQMLGAIGGSITRFILRRPPPKNPVRSPEQDWAEEVALRSLS